MKRGKPSLSALSRYGKDQGNEGKALFSKHKRQSCWCMPFIQALDRRIGGVQVHTGLYGKFEAGLWYVRPYLKEKENRKRTPGSLWFCNQLDHTRSKTDHCICGHGESTVEPQEELSAHSLRVPKFKANILLHSRRNSGSETDTVHLFLSRMCESAACVPVPRAAEEDIRSWVSCLTQVRGAQLRSPEEQDMTSLLGHFSRPRHMMFSKGFLESKSFLLTRKSLSSVIIQTRCLLNDN